MKERIKTVLKRALKLDNISDNISRETSTNWDSLAQLNIAIELEDEFKISFTPNEISLLNSIIEIEKIILRKT